jgi:hypothetical protein
MIDATRPIGAKRQLGLSAAGLVDMPAWPAESMTTHRAVDTQEIALGELRVPIFDPVHVGRAAAGSVEISAWPNLSTATHNDVEGQEMS